MKILYYFKLLRPLNVIISAISVVISAAIVNGLGDTKTLIIASVIVMLYAAGSNALNDAIDHEIDLINKPSRPIPSGHMTINEALVISFVFFSLGSALCLQLPTTAIIIGVVIAVPMMIVYSTHLKGKSILGNIAVSLILGMAFLFSGAAYDSIVPMWIPMMLAFGLTFIRELVKDIADMDGDQFSGLQTFPIIYGINRSIQLIVLLCVLVGCGSFIPYFNGIYGVGYVLLLVIGVEIPLVVVIVLLMKNPSISSATYCARILKFSTLMGLFAIYLGTI